MLKIALTIGKYSPIFLLLIYACIAQFSAGNIVESETIRHGIFGSITFYFLAMCFFDSMIGNRLDKIERNKIGMNEIKMTGIKPYRPDYLDTKITYLLPLIVLTMEISTDSLIILNIILLVFIISDIRTENFYKSNVILYLSGYRLYAGCNLANQKKILLLPKKLQPHNKDAHKYNFVEFGSKNVYIFRSMDEED